MNHKQVKYIRKIELPFTILGLCGIKTKKMQKSKQRIVKLKDVDSLDDFQFQICNNLKLKGWQFDNLPIKEKILKWTQRNPDKELILEIYKEFILKKVHENISRVILTTRIEIPKNYEIGNPLNRWVHNETIIRTKEQGDEDKKKIETAFKEEFKKINSLIENIKTICSIRIIE